MTTHQLSDSAYPALLTLLRDRSDPELRGLIHDQLRQLDLEALRHLRSLALYAPDETMMDIEAILQQRVWEELGNHLPTLLQPGPLDLLDLQLFLVRFGRLDAHEETIRTDVALLIDACRAALHQGETPYQSADKLAQVIGTDLGFTGNKDEYYDPDNFYLDSVLRTRRGIPISLSALYLLAAQALDLPLYGIGLPGHFIVGLFPAEQAPVFYNPFDGGARLTVLDCDRLVHMTGQSFHENMLRPASHRDIFQRMLTNLYHLYAKREEDARRTTLEGYLRQLTHESPG